MEGLCSMKSLYSLSTDCLSTRIKRAIANVDLGGRLGWQLHRADKAKVLLME